MDYKLGCFFVFAFCLKKYVRLYPAGKPFVCLVEA